MKKTLLLSMIVGAMLMFSGCATILDGKTQKIPAIIENREFNKFKYHFDTTHYKTTLKTPPER